MSIHLQNSCPACKKSSKKICDWEFSGLNNSIFNYTAQFHECEHCGLVYIHNITDNQLSLFYEKECDYHDKNHFSMEQPENILKYTFYKQFLLDMNLDNTALCDIGCGRGGFIQWLKEDTWEGDCIGVDVDIKSIPTSNTLKHSISFQEGTAKELPFKENSQKLLTYFHVLEHIKEIDIVLQEAYRVLEDDGHILIEVPDAQRYEDIPIGTAFWFTIREHIFHFTSSALQKALNNNGFSVINLEQPILPTPEFEYPSLMILAKKSKVVQNIPVVTTDRLGTFLLQSKKELDLQIKQILTIQSQYSNLVFWGCSSEIFSILPHLKGSKIQICDSSKLKQKSRYNNFNIMAPEIVDKSGALIIAPYLHAQAIKSHALNLGWDNKNIFILQ